MSRLDTGDCSPKGCLQKYYASVQAGIGSDPQRKAMRCFRVSYEDMPPGSRLSPATPNLALHAIGQL